MVLYLSPVPTLQLFQCDYNDPVNKRFLILFFTVITAKGDFRNNLNPQGMINRYFNCGVSTDILSWREREGSRFLPFEKQQSFLLGPLGNIDNGNLISKYLRKQSAGKG
jgi:hypothetical protein